MALLRCAVSSEERQGLRAEPNNHQRARRAGDRARSRDPPRLRRLLQVWASGSPPSHSIGSRATAGLRAGTGWRAEPEPEPGRKAPRRRGCGRGRGGERRAQPGETWRGGSWRASQRVGDAGGGAGGGEIQAGERKAGGERRRQAASGARSRCRGGWTQPSYPQRGEGGWARRNPRPSPASGPRAPRTAPCRAPFGLQRVSAQAGEGRRLVGRPSGGSPRRSGGRNHGIGNSSKPSKPEGSAGAEAGWPPSIDLALAADQSEAPCLT
jgi:hypothetical protein